MAQISRRLRNTPDASGDAWEVFHRARALQAQGVDLLDLTIGEHDIPTAQAVLDAMHEAALDGHTGYAAVPGIAPLRDAVAARLTARTGLPHSRENVMITPGGQMALFAAHLAVCDPGDTGLIIDPYYATYPGTLRALDIVPVAVHARPENGFQPRAQVILEAAQSNGARSLLINSPNNPTGAVYSAQTLDAIAEAAQTADLWLISDEVYDSQVWDGVHLPMAARPDMAARCLSIGSLSKSHAMTGSRLGWISGPAEVIAALIELATHTTYGVPGYIQRAGLFALSQGDAFEHSVAAPFRRRRDRVRAWLKTQPHLRAIPPQGAMYVMLDIRETGLSGTAFALGLLERMRVAVMPGESFGAAASGHLRIALTLPDDKLDLALERIGTYAADLVAQKGAG
jgi:arginine:pyruvate transaminase